MYSQVSIPHEEENVGHNIYRKKENIYRMDANLSFDESLLELGKILGLDRAVSKEVLFAALENDTYVHNLLVCRRTPEFMNQLLDNPPKAAIEIEHPDEKWIARAAKALIAWGKTGFSIVDDTTLKLREDACLSCPHLIDPMENKQKSSLPRGEISKIGDKTGKKICKICGCNAANKMRRTTASCPSKDLSRDGVSRWGEPLQDNTSPGIVS